ncbi:MAG: 50S ribosomal protein L9 [Bacteroidetes bacterium]|jgi:large subunit ribosomal protein L9|nr:50S ribosomal protein L9 [Bacteroidota bacterium]MBU1580950.1 50S ribosomal protein L9 [Bacteroidota bacterium]MBU2466279.1 50S ribosomal protein L9 [Bacteroidota bacterium]MBU2557740.1 50S ribosomal protein L9 [Bacteroidota bacterium]MDA3943752.1 50S ribosomal protein L9 [Bacteroidota bacterium]
MEVILKQDINNLGYTNDIVSVKDGYARNYLIPNRLAIIANPTNRKVLEELKKQQSFKEEKVKNEALAISKALEGLQLKIAVKAGTSGKIFGSVNSVMIANAIKEAKNIEIDRKRIHINEDAVKELGNYNASIKLHKEVQFDVAFEVFAE